MTPTEELTEANASDAGASERDRFQFNEDMSEINSLCADIQRWVLQAAIRGELTKDRRQLVASRAARISVITGND